jgi:hypothetical protein
MDHGLLIRDLKYYKMVGLWYYTEVRMGSYPIQIGIIGGNDGIYPLVN